MRGRDWLIAAGFLIAGIGIVAVVAPGVIGFSVGSVAVTVLGGLMLLQGALSVLDADASLEEAETGDPELLRPMPRPGDAADRAISRLAGTYGRPGGRQKSIHDRVTRAAANAIAKTEGVTVEAAHERIERAMTVRRREYEVIADLDESGTATTRSHTPGKGARRLIRWWRAEESSLQHRIRRAIDGIGRRLDMPPLDGADRLAGTDGIDERDDPPTRKQASADGGREAVTEIADGVYRRDERRTGQWVGMVSVALAFGGAGVVASQPPLVLAAAVGIGFAAYSNHTDEVDATVAIERSIEPEQPAAGEETTVTLTIRNTGANPLADLRVVDGVPERVEVTAGVPRMGTALMPGEAATVEYGVRARPGTHEFDDVTVLVRDASGSIEAELFVEVGTDLVCLPSLRGTDEPVPLRDVALGFVGRTAIDRGAGVEFDSVREYRSGDPMGRVDWNRYARTGELSTVRFREERSTTVHLLLDTRREAYLAPDDDGEHAVERGVRAAGRLFAALASTSTPISISAFGPDRCWLDAGVGDDHRRRAEQLFGTDPAFDPLPPAGQTPLFDRVREIQKHLPGDAQIVFVTPLCDGAAPFVARRLNDLGHPVSVFSPNPTTGDTLGGKLVRIERRLWALDLLGSGVPVVDWAWDEPIEAALWRGAMGAEE